GLLLSMLKRSAAMARDISIRLAELAAAAGSMAQSMDFGMFYDASRELLSVGYDHTSDSLNTGCYDLLASEARVAAFVGIAKGEIPQQAWLRLGRPLTRYGKSTLLLSWSGTMFEYLLPFLWMKHEPDTLLAQSAQAAVSIQKDLGRQQ